jgi:hypothetical protein
VPGESGIAFYDCRFAAPGGDVLPKTGDVPSCRSASFDVVHFITSGYQSLTEEFIPYAYSSFQRPRSGVNTKTNSRMSK